ncbi:MAG: hypothetical protein JSS09_06535 [Verrucomicrobia bacterium]|nr:hypothetical protein [Verrucomicrobiota bacterium]
MIPSRSNPPYPLICPKKIESDLTTFLGFHTFIHVVLPPLPNIGLMRAESTPLKQTIQKIKQTPLFDSKPFNEAVSLPKGASQKTKVHFEYFEEKLTDDLWWTKKELEEFKSQAISELGAFVTVLGGSRKNAAMVLYQPKYSHICEMYDKCSALNSTLQKIEQIELFPHEPCLEKKKPPTSVSINSSAKSKSVRFNSLGTRVLIPTRAEYHKEDLASDLWWTKTEIEKNKKLAIKAVMEKYPTVSFKTATKMIYRPQLLKSKCSS